MLVLVIFYTNILHRQGQDVTSLYNLDGTFECS